MRIGILGPEGTFSETAAMQWLKVSRKGTGKRDDVQINYYETIVDVAESIMRKEVDYGIVPIENSLEGSVGETLDLLSSEENEPEIRIVGEILIPIQICLLAKQTSGNSDQKALQSFAGIRTVVSHPHALAQCKQFIRDRLRAKGVEVKSVDSTAAAAKMAMEDEEVAALASEEAAKRYRLTILAENVQDSESVTRFVTLSTSDIETEATGKDKTSLLIYLRDRPGALYEVLGEFAHRKINLTKIESRPSKRALGDYMFHIDCEGHLEDKEIKEALEGVKRKVARLKVLGAYPKAK
ncbi:MAG: prephenate dehydratase [Methanophagales archaeon ANME-1-THS]|nr:MAG: prephenate dehydratase [Methanophagales archaeon ANME-1-THS]